MKARFSLLVVLSLFAVQGCAGTQDIRNVQREQGAALSLYEQKISNLNASIDSLKEANLSLQREADRNSEVLNNLRRNQAETIAAITELRDHVQQLRGSIETMRKDAAAAGARVTKREEELKEMKDRLEALSFNLRYLENFLGLARREEQQEQIEKGKTPASTPKVGLLKGSKTEKEIAFTTAYEAFREGKYEKARSDFLNYLKLFPESEFSDNAQFGIAECYYFENKFDRAIVEYEKLIKNYPESNKVSQALLKLGLSYINVGERSKARSVLQQVIKDYPNTSQARTARLKLIELK